MIKFNQVAQAGLTNPQKQPLYVLTIPQLGIMIASFPNSAIPPTKGWGEMLWGIDGWGT